MSPSPAAGNGNRSFARKSPTDPERVIYATLDSVALKRATLPLKLPPSCHQSEITGNPTEEDEDDSSSDASGRNRKYNHHCDDENDEAKTKKSRKTRIRTVLEFVPSRFAVSGRRKGTVSPSLEISDPTNFVHVASASDRRFCSLDLPVFQHSEKCATVPLLKRPESIRDRTIVDYAEIDTWVVVTTKREKQQDVDEDDDNDHARSGPAESRPKKVMVPNSSFLWSNERLKGTESEATKVDPYCTDGDDEYDDVGIGNEKDSYSALDYYDDVGLPPTNLQEEAPGKSKNEDGDDVDDDVYDDVLPSESAVRSIQDSSLEEKRVVARGHLLDDEGYSCVEADEEDEKLRNLDRPQHLLSPPEDKDLRREDDLPRNCRRHPERNHDGPSDEDEHNYDNQSEDGRSQRQDRDRDEAEDQESIYDDVSFPSSSLGHQERVNSIYAGSVQLESSKESDWEDLGESLLLWTDSSTSQKRPKCGLRRARRLRRDRSRCSRKSLTRPSHSSGIITARRQDQDHHRRVIVSSLATGTVAVSLGSGSVLQFRNPTALPEAEDPEARCANAYGQPPYRHGSIVQLRLLCDEHSQEASCYLCDEDNAGDSDDGNYESLCDFDSDDFSSESESESRLGGCSNLNEAPMRPVPPPPPRASSSTSLAIGRTLGKRMKMLRRTWSITKDSLGRMRRKASGENHATTTTTATTMTTTTSSTGISTPGATDDDKFGGKKYFSFRRQAKNHPEGFSTFYLDRNDKETDIEVYGNVKATLANGDDNRILGEEPLYQFYVAATNARFALDSDTDGYEEVENSDYGRNVGVVTSELGQPGQRTLWCQSARVVQSGLLQCLTPEERKIQEAKFEILTSEASYLNSLRVLKNEFLADPELINEILTLADIEKLFGGVPGVLAASERFLSALESVWNEDPMLKSIPEVLLKHAEDSLEVYVSYCSNQVSMGAALKELRGAKGSKFSEVLSRIESKASCQSLNLHSFLMLPMQRVTRLPLLADAVLSKLSMEHEERAKWERALATLSFVVAMCNEGARSAGQRLEMENLARKLEYSTKVQPIDLQGKCLVRSGSVIRLLSKHETDYKLTFGKRFSKTALYLFLLTDYLLVARPKSSSETYTVIDSCKRSLLTLESISDEDSPFAGRRVILLTLLENHQGREVEYVLSCDSDTEKERWLEAVSPPRSNLVGETLYETWDCPQVMALYSYSPVQPDELLLQPGDVINVLRKMPDGWYHGEKLLDGEQGWFPSNFTKEVASEHVRARNLKQRHRLLAFNHGSSLQRGTK